MKLKFLSDLIALDVMSVSKLKRDYIPINRCIMGSMNFGF